MEAYGGLQKTSNKFSVTIITACYMLVSLIKFTLWLSEILKYYHGTFEHVPTKNKQNQIKISVIYFTVTIKNDRLHKLIQIFCL